MMDFVRVGVAALVVRDQKVLVQRRTGSHGAGKWALPGGHQEFGESPEQTAVRELAEEMGIEARAVRRLGFSDDQMPEDSKHHVTIFVRCELVSGEPRIMEPEKATELAWKTVAELRAMGDDLFSPLRRFLSEVSRPHIEVCIDVNDIDRQAQFWQTALGYQRGSTKGAYVNLLPQNDNGPIVFLQLVPEPKATKNRLHLDLHVEDPVSEVKRLVEAGASCVGASGSADDGSWWQVMADPEGNEFCVMNCLSPTMASPVAE